MRFNPKVFTGFLLFISALFSLNATAYAEEVGALAPQAALEYMKANQDLMIIDTALPEYFEKQHFIGAINIPAKAMESHYAELPQGAKVMVHCRIGKTCLPVYKLLVEKRSDLVLSYISGAPLFEEYNDWVTKYRQK